MSKYGEGSSSSVRKILLFSVLFSWQVNLMNPVVIYSTRGGNTEKVALEIAKELKAAGLKIDMNALVDWRITRQINSDAKKLRFCRRLFVG